MNLREALIVQAPSLALQRSAQAEIARLDAEVDRMARIVAEARDDLAVIRGMVDNYRQRDRNFSSPF